MKLTEAIIKIENLTKQYDDQIVVEQLSLSIKKRGNLWIAWAKRCWQDDNYSYVIGIK